MSRIVLPESFTAQNAKENLKIESSKYNKIAIIGGKTALSKAKDTLDYAFSEKEKAEIWYGGECSYNNVNKIYEQLLNSGVDLVIGVGGGKALDTAKVVADKMGIDIFTVPTIAATCAAYTALSVMYNDDGSFKDLYFMSRSAKKTFIDMEIILNSPKKYTLAGIGDTLAKYYEVFLKTKDKDLNFNSITGKKISELCKDIIIQYGTDSIKTTVVNEEFKNVVECILLSTGKVSLLVDQEYNGAIAHSVCYGLTNLKSVEEHHLHGEIVGYGILIQMLIEGKLDEYRMLKSFYEEIGLPVKLEELCDLREYRMKEESVLDGIMSSPNLDGIPLQVNREMFRGVLLEN